MTGLAHPLSQSQVEAADRLRNRLRHWVAVDAALSSLQKQFPGFDFEATLLKAAAINQFYGTNLYAVARMAEHIAAEMATSIAGLDEAEVVRRLAALPKTATQKYARNHWSFASKFAHFFIDPARFPIYDEYAMKTAKWHLGRKGQVWAEPNEYKAFCENLRRLKERSSLACGFAELDRYLWLAGLYRAWLEDSKAKINTEVARLFEDAAHFAAVHAELKALLPGEHAGA